VKRREFIALLGGAATAWTPHLREVEMIVSFIARGAGAFLMTLGWLPHSTLAQENLVATYGETGTSLAFNVPDAVVQKFLPEGWRAPRNWSGANVSLYLVERIVATETARTFSPPSRNATLNIGIVKNAENSRNSLVVAGLTSDARGAPGPYGVYVNAKAILERNSRTDTDGSTEMDESWEFTGNDGAYLHVQLQFDRQLPYRATSEARAYSAIKPDFYLTHKTDSGSVAVHEKKYVLKALGPKFSEIFSGSEQLIRVESVPWLWRQVYTPPVQ
jgi:hypothetical protein